MDRERAEEQIAMIREYNEALRAERDMLRAEAARLRGALEVGIKSAHPHPTEHPTMTAAWKVMADALSSTPSTAEWLSARDAEMKRLGAAEWLEATVKRSRGGLPEGMISMYFEDALEEAASLRAGKGE